MFQLGNRLWHTDSSFRRLPARSSANSVWPPIGPLTLIYKPHKSAVPAACHLIGGVAIHRDEVEQVLETALVAPMGGSCRLPRAYQKSLRSY
jgi:hypothetical protein